MKNVNLQMAEEKIFVETKVKYIDPDYTAAQKLKAETLAANEKFEAMKKAEAEEFDPFVWGGSK